MLGYFANPFLLAGAGMVAAPILIHLINRLRFKRIRWAAMEFLLESDKRNRRRVLLEQLLLLALRCLLVLLIVTIVARPKLGETLSSLLYSGERTEHVVVLDDSYSMGQQQGPNTTFESGVKVVERLVEALASRPGNHQLTLLRSSQTEPDLLSARVDQQLPLRLRTIVNGWQVTNLATPPADGLSKADQRISEMDASNRVLHFITDFRTKDWPNDGPLPQGFKKLDEEGVKLHLIDMAPPAAGNLSIERVYARLGSVVAEVPFKVEAVVHNFSSETAEKVAVTPVIDGRPLPSRVIDRIAPGKSESINFDVQLLGLGPHEITVAIPSDALSIDNRRFLALDIRERIPVLLVDGGQKQVDAQFMTIALSPGGSVRTGIDPTLKTPDALSKTNLDDYRVVFLMNVARLEEPAVKALTAYVERGGGLALFVGDQVQVDNYNALLHAGGKGILPVKLGALRQISESTNEPTSPDLVFTKHPVFKVFEGERNPFVEAVRIERLFAPADDFKPGKDVKVIASYRDGGQLALEATRGNGRVIVFLTTAGPDWNTWARNPSYVISMLELEAYLAEPVSGTPNFRVGEPWELKFDPAAYRRDLIVQLPTVEGGEAIKDPVQAEVAGNVCLVKYSKTQAPGTYRMNRTAFTTGAAETMVRSYNIDPAEGDLTRLSAQQTAQQMQGIKYMLHTAEDFQGDLGESAFEPRDWLLLAFIVILVCEQLLAKRLSYHLR